MFAKCSQEKLALKKRKPRKMLTLFSEFLEAQLMSRSKRNTELGQESFTLIVLVLTQLVCNVFKVLCLLDSNIVLSASYELVAFAKIAHAYDILSCPEERAK